MATYLITGSSQGLGAALVKELVSRPTSQVSVVFAATRSDSPSQELYDTIKSAAGRVHHIKLDVNSEDSVNAAVAKTETLLSGKGLDCLINNAGVGARFHGPIWEVKDLSTCFDTNVVAVHRVSTAFLPLLRKGNLKQIMNISSTQGSIGRATWPYHMRAVAPDYKVSKAALNMLTIQWHISLKDEGFCIQAMSPGHLHTNLGSGGGAYNADLPADVGAKSVADTVLSSEKDDSGRFRDIEVKGWHERYAGKDVIW